MRDRRDYGSEGPARKAEEKAAIERFFGIICALPPGGVGLRPLISTEKRPWESLLVSWLCVPQARSDRVWADFSGFFSKVSFFWGWIRRCIDKASPMAVFPFQSRKRKRPGRLP